MARWAPDTGERLRRAALELFEERGFTTTTVADIVERAGVTRRTFFRHFSDKREVFFGDDEIPALATRMIASAPPAATPMRLVREGLRTLAVERFEPRRSEMRSARRLIAAEPALLERDLQKQADLRRAVRDGFVARGVDVGTARVVAGLTVEVLQIALDAWLADPDEASFTVHLDAVADRMRALLAD